MSHSALVLFVLVVVTWSNPILSVTIVDAVHTYDRVIGFTSK